MKGCLDLGSSYFRLLVAERIGTGKGPDIKPVFEDRRFVGWGREAVKEGYVSEESLNRAGDLLNELLHLSAVNGCPDPVIAGTGTFRKARNSREIVSFLSDSCSCKLRVLTEEGEAAYSFLGASSILPDDRQAVLIDLGGTSTEIASGGAGSFDDYLEIPFGTHSLASAARRPSGRLMIRSLRNCLVNLAGDGFFPGSEEIEGRGISLNGRSSFLLTGGTAVTAGMIHQLMSGVEPDPGRTTGMRMDDWRLLVRRVRGLPVVSWQRLLTVSGERAELLPAGIVLLNFILESMNIKMFRITSRDLRWGVILSGEAIAGRYVF
ncbi:MAG: hypothetical protein R6U43_02245 [Candidatus Krumholzibacteriales bacterium]